MQTRIERPQTRLAAWMRGPGISTACVLAAVVGCSDERQPGGPEGAAPVEPAAAVAAAALPGWLTALLSSLPAEAKPVWQQCQAAGTMQPSGTPYVVGVNCRMIRIDGHPRRYVVYVPNHPNVAGGADVPLVVMYHGSGQNGEHFLLESGWLEQADSSGFLVAFPSGLPYFVLSEARMQTQWNSFALAADIDPAVKPAGYPALAPWPASDVPFTDSLLTDVIAHAHIDTLRIHVSGFSNGGGFVSRLAVEKGDRIASAAAITSPYVTEYTPPTLIPYFFGTGSRDSHAVDQINSLLLAGQPAITELPLDTASLFQYASVRQRIDTMAATLDLDAGGVIVAGDPTWTLMRWTVPLPGNTAGNEAWWGIVGGLTHEYPRGPGRRLPQNNPAGFDGPRTFWAFFRTHPK